MMYILHNNIIGHQVSDKYSDCSFPNWLKMNKAGLKAHSSTGCLSVWLHFGTCPRLCIGQGLVGDCLCLTGKLMSCRPLSVITGCTLTKSDQWAGHGLGSAEKATNQST